MNRRVLQILCFTACCATSSALGQTITWNSDANAVNLRSDNLPMDGGFHFELGVFTGSFVPTAGNKADWAANWRAAPNARTEYDSVSARFSASHTPLDNEAPFVANKSAYVWGFKGGALSGEWILFRKTTWLWPDAFPPVPPAANAYEWFAKNATAVIGTINASGSPFLMKSEAVTNAAPPPTSYTQWQADQLTGEPQNAPNQDPDHDGTSNLLEFVFGTPPKVAGAPTITPVSLVSGWLQITIPRRLDHPAVLTVEVSDNLTNWQSGPAATEVVDDGLASLVVRDLTVLDSLHPQRFIRLKAAVSTP